MNKVFIGYDQREDIAYEVCKSSILRRSDVKVIPLKQNELREQGLYWREQDPLASTEFTYTRFLVPELCKFKGWGLFIDCDTIVNVDINELFELADDKYAVMCVQHDYTPTAKVKMDGKKQTLYPRKNWSSVMLFNCGHPSNRKLTKEVVNDIMTLPSYLHQFKWLDDKEIGSLPIEWNWLVGWYKEGKPKLIHYTEGGPWFEDYKYCEYHELWNEELKTHRRM